MQVEFPKTNSLYKEYSSHYIDEEWFGDYEVEISARIYDNEEADDYVEIEAASYVLKFSEPVYSDSDLIDKIEAVNN